MLFLITARVDRTLDRHIRDETNLVNTVPVSVLQVPDKMSLTVASFNIDLEQFQVFKKSILCRNLVWDECQN